MSSPCELQFSCVHDIDLLLCTGDRRLLCTVRSRVVIVSVVAAAAAAAFADLTDGGRG